MLDSLLDILKSGNHKVLYKINDDVITYRECYDKVIELSDNLKKQGSSPVVVYGHKSINQFVSILACIVAKRCYIPIDTSIPLNRIWEIIDLTKTNLIIKNEEINLDNNICFTIDEINEKYRFLSTSVFNDNKDAYIIFTSGSTGKSKGVPITYHNLENFIKWITSVHELEMCRDLKVLSQASFSFDLSVMDIYFSLYKGCSIIAVDRDTKEDLVKMYDVIWNETIDFLVLTPTFVKMLLIDEFFHEDNFSNIKYLFFCGESLEVETVKKIRSRFRNVNIINAYGPTEATCCISLIRVTDDMLQNKMIPVGRISTSAVDITIHHGEILLKGDSVFCGYLGLSSMVDYYKTGDIGYIENDFLYCNGRIDSQIKYRGYRIELGDIENNLLKIGGIREAVVICKYKNESNVVRLIKAYVTVDTTIDEVDIKKELAKLVPSYMVPKSIIVLEEMPVNNNGKYDRKKLSEL